MNITIFAYLSFNRFGTHVGSVIMPLINVSRCSFCLWLTKRSTDFVLTYTQMFILHSITTNFRQFSVYDMIEAANLIASVSRKIDKAFWKWVNFEATRINGNIFDNFGNSVAVFSHFRLSNSSKSIHEKWKLYVKVYRIKRLGNTENVTAPKIYKTVIHLLCMKMFESLFDDFLPWYLYTPLNQEDILTFVAYNQRKFYVIPTDLIRNCQFPQKNSLPPKFFRTNCPSILWRYWVCSCFRCHYESE